MEGFPLCMLLPVAWVLSFKVIIVVLEKGEPGVGLCPMHFPVGE